MPDAIPPKMFPAHDHQARVDVQHEDDQSSLTSDATQTGVKSIEAVSQTWTQSSLIAAYLG